MKRRIFVGLTLLLVSATTPVLCAKKRILLHRIGPSESTLFIANADGSNEHPLLPNSGFDYNASFSADGKWIIFTSERGGSADIYRVHPEPLPPGAITWAAAKPIGALRGASHVLNKMDLE
jgi:hypothetical protein